MSKKQSGCLHFARADKNLEVTDSSINACTHRSYTNNGSVQVELYPDRLEVSNPGALPYGFTIDQLTQLHNSQPSNPILAHPVYLAGYIERIGTGTTDIVEKCVESGLPTPEYKQDGMGFKVVIWRKNVPQLNVLHGRFSQNVTPDVTSDVTPDNPLPKNVIRIKEELTDIFTNRHITIEELAQKYKVTTRTIHRDFVMLRNTFSIEWRPTSQYTGYWEIHELK